MKISSLFYINSENNFDQASPLIWFLLKKKYKVFLQISQNFNYEEDYRFKLFKNFDNFKVLKQSEHKESFFLYYFLKVLNFIIKKNFIYIKKNFYLFSFLKTLFSKVSNLRKIGINFIFYSWGDFSHHIIPAKFLDIHSIALPHGFNIYLNENTNYLLSNTLKNKNKTFEIFSDHNLYDYYIVENQITKARALNLGINEKIIKVWGSARYSKKWIKYNYSILKKNLAQLNKKKVLFLLPHWSFKVDIDKTFKLVKEVLNKFPNQVTAKPHVRGKFNKYDLKANKLLTKFKNKYNLKIANKVKTPELILKHEIIIGFGTSVLIDALYLNKKLIIADHLQKNKTIYTLCKLSNVTKSSMQCIDKIITNDFTSKKSKEFQDLADKFILQLNKKKDILDNYINELQKIKTLDKKF
ncbi:hypothetical protein SAR11G3_00093 [Candidatus Pelagibacter sp. IMCC9063]|uniref:hypothetical protein n=1 Tax=Pelagibacter sp. (strain IMCC9063) TaxID=1002672 RepID=UPI00020464C6|nr:hypothetical protein [Candidatus Pelagibacter sp. IMCC9063]AEA80568.1 hypothetical protein SAR11G3_00093 [Candidatus Pelagibacter sp. IMCC9063]|tara:strand:- start:20682 stop:21914 length:1233 start_codon:yes stop_codon:yes gene_type:complete